MVDAFRYLPFMWILHDTFSLSKLMLLIVLFNCMISCHVQESNDALKNDEMEKVADDTTQGLKEMGAFGLQVRS